MSPLDLALLAAILVLAAWRLLLPDRGRSWRAAACATAALLAVVQFAVDGFTWQFVPGWLLLVAASAPWRLSARWLRWTACAGLLGLMALAAGPWLLAPTPKLPAPAGPHPVGTEVFRLVDAARPETLTAAPADRRNVIVQAWYPAAPGAPQRRLPYIDGPPAAFSQVSVLPGFVFGRFDRIDTHAAAAARVSGDKARWPVVIFSPGYGAPRAFYAGLAADLASRGYVVLALDHPYETDITELADGRVVRPAATAPAPHETSEAYMETRVRVRAADMRFVVDRITAGDGFGRLNGRLDPARVAAIGHSFGGAASALAAGEDPRLEAAANIDGALWSPVAAEAFRGPFLLLESDHAETGHGERYNLTNGDLVARAAHGAWRFEVKRANHFSFTDAPLYFTPPGQWLVSQMIGGGRGAAETQRLTVDILDAFLAGPLKGAPGDPATAAARYRDVRGGRI